MSEDRSTHDSKFDERLPIILAVHREENVGKPQRRTNSVITVFSKEDSAPKFFNKVQKDYQQVDGIFVFLSEHDFFYDETALDRIAYVIGNTPFRAVYSDVMIHAHNMIPHIMPPYDINGVDKPVNTPLAVHRKALTEWNEKYQDAYFYDYYKQLTKKFLLAQIPHPLFVTKYHTVNKEETITIRNG